MNTVETRDKMREVYGFDKDDPTFDQFYEGLMILLKGDACGALTRLSAIMSKSSSMCIYKFVVVAMIDNGASSEQIEPIVSLWKCESVRRGNEREEEASSFVLDILNVDASSENRGDIVKEKMSRFVTDGFKRMHTNTGTKD